MRVLTITIVQVSHKDFRITTADPATGEVHSTKTSQPALASIAAISQAFPPEATDGVHTTH